jgi:cbb3-type cytochrome oxidase subunit 3
MMQESADFQVLYALSMCVYLCNIYVYSNIYLNFYNKM